MKLERCIERAAARLEDASVAFGHGTDNAWDEAAWLVLHALGMPVNQPADLQSDVDKHQQTDIERLLQQRISTRKPAAYLTGTAWFAGLPFHTAEGVIVPRSHIASFLQEAGRPWLDAEKVHRVLDLCTGSGCIAVAAAMSFTAAHVDATDIDEQALKLARKNIQLHGLESRVDVFASNIYDHVTGRYDVILSNPPYVPSRHLRDLPDEFQHEPRRAFDGGSDGLVLVHRILRGAARRLNENGILVVEVGETWAALEQAYPDVPFVWLDTGVEDSGLFLLTKQQLEEFYS